MNERIKSIAEQAGFVLWQDEPWNPGDIVDWAARYDDELKKFAELIVQECCNVLYDNELGGYQVNYVLKEHFGVKD